ncbi:hypothetical protein [Streptomyces sp. BA2]|uniref:hypothetical protein n=1 Tax=Streptomyces sp. BA2 TaxID=436595 RepID=UPI00132BA108|nr:hypothetical protein [Streptomyces sp. BA2]MWA11626.1 hypothetical protein [Streptomyces sp. BA2]
MRRTTLAAVCLATAAALGLTACGTETGGSKKAEGKGVADAGATKEAGPFPGMSGPDIVDKAVKATTDASSLRVKGSVPDETGTIELDMAFDTKGQCAGTMAMGGEGSMELITTARTVYMKYDEEFLRAQGKGEPAADTQAAVDMLAGRWVKTSATGADAKDIASFCDLDVLLAEFKDVNSLARKGKTTTVDGTPALTLTESDGTDRYTLYVATEGKPYLLKVVNETAKTPESLAFSDFDKPVDATPPAGDIMDIDKLAG